MVSDNAIETSDDYPIFEKLLMVNENEISRQQAEVLREALYERMAILQTDLASLESQLNADENLRELAEIERNQAEILRNQLKQELETLKTQLTDLSQSVEFSLQSLNTKLIEVGNKLTEMTNLMSSLSNAEALRVTAELNRSEKETLRQQAETNRAGFYDGFAASLSALTNLKSNFIQGTTQSVEFNSDGTVHKVTHTGVSGIVRVDTFTYSTNLIAEERRLTEGDTIKFVNNLDTFETEVL